MFDMIRLIFCRMPLQNSVMLKLKTKNRNHIKLFLHHWSEKIYKIQIQIFLKYHLQKCTLLSLQELKSQDIVSISTLSALMLFLSCFCYALMLFCLLMPCGHLLGKSRPLGSRLWCLIVTLAHSHRYPWSGVVLDCIDSWFLPSFLLCTTEISTV